MMKEIQVGFSNLKSEFFVLNYNLILKNAFYKFLIRLRVFSYEFIDFRQLNFMKKRC